MSETTAPGRAIEPAPAAPAEPQPWPVDQCGAPGCDAPLIWATSKNLRAIPIDAEPVKGGNVLLREMVGRTEPEAHVVGNPARLFGKTTYTSHLAHCPAADKYRRPRRSS